ncbi:uncharacterized protein [Drosophila takahashii]|uniref:uncharacterized protein isoform X2 n=1 Tax=Drosophila takahashii TaxID=29030 RepID=UPI001CF92730|nr:uncharacterized protein LOC108067303 isoform X2 [Drosophila takahashii]
MEYGNGMQYEGYGQGGEGYEMNYDQMGRGQGYSQQPEGYGQESRNYQSGSAALGGPGYRSPLRYNKILREMNSRNGLYNGEVARAIIITHYPALAAPKAKLISRETMETPTSENLWPSHAVCRKYCLRFDVLLT